MSESELREQIEKLVYAIRNDGWNNGFNTPDEPWINQLLALTLNYGRERETKATFLNHKCPSCGSKNLYVSNGYITCGLLSCKNPTLADERLEALKEKSKA